MNFTDWLLNQNYTHQDFHSLKQQHQFDLIKAFLLGADYE
tara:strand:+ start:504 stop:623 length:120 start_codon:yes stop_codon:yes gene_type:complete